MSQPSPPWMGIDLGTSTSELSLYREGSVPDVLTVNGDQITDSVVTLDPTNRDRKVYVGSKGSGDRKYFKYSNAKRFIGLRLDSVGAQIIKTYLDPQIRAVPDQFARVLFRTAPYLNSEQEVCWVDIPPHEISAEILKAFKARYRELNPDIEKPVAVITIPAAFLEPQKAATRKAAELAGIEVARLLHEPTAAAICYLNALDEKERAGRYLVFDFGGGTHDVSIVKVDGDKYVVEVTTGEAQLGGGDIDNLLYEEFVKMFEEKGLTIRVQAGTSAEQATKIKRSQVRLMTHAQRIKKELSYQETATLRAEDIIGDDAEIEWSVTRTWFEELLNLPLPKQKDRDSLVEKLFAPVERALSEAKLTKADLQGVLAAGGSCRIPLVQKKLREYFPKHKIRIDDQVDFVVAKGAAIVAEALRKKSRNFESESLADKSDLLAVSECLRHSIGIEVRQTIDGDFAPILERNISIPAKRMKIFQTVEDNQTTVRISVYDGEDKFVKNNNYIDHMLLKGIPEAKKGEAKIEVTIQLNESGELFVSAHCITGEGTPPTEMKVQRATETKEIYAPELKSAMLELTKRAYKIEVLARDTGVQRQTRTNVNKKLAPILDWLHDFHGYGNIDKAAVQSRIDALRPLEEELKELKTPTTPLSGGARDSVSPAPARVSVVVGSPIAGELNKRLLSPSGGFGKSLSFSFPKDDT